ncbi:MAG: hypothetical protein K0B85_05745 [Coriobacteriia bacterium]|nr:hypothetical protein [Coriobacteriia bacterium]
MKRALLAVLTAVLLLAFAGTALAADPQTWDEADPYFGSSTWKYRDMADSFTKYESGYDAFDGVTGLYEGNVQQQVITGEYLIANPFERDMAVTWPAGTYNKSIKVTVKNAPIVDGTLEIVPTVDSRAIYDDIRSSLTITSQTVDLKTGYITVNFSYTLNGDVTFGRRHQVISWAANYTYEYTPGPHGDYDTTTNNCKVCHAVHRAGGAFMLMRVDKPDDACSYCHVGAGRHARKWAYTSDADGSIYPENGHTIGSGKEIPNSSVWQWQEEVTMGGGYDFDTGGYESTLTVNVRAYDQKRNSMFKISIRGQQGVDYTTQDGEDLDITTKYMRIYRGGPRYLWCMTCHQPHNSQMLVWSPLNAPKGYKLLRNAPSGSMLDEDAMRDGSTAGLNYTDPRNYPGWTKGDTAALENLGFAKVPDTELSKATTGVGKTIYTEWNGPTAPIVAQSISVWCADCHNLNIGYSPGRAYGGIDKAFGGSTYTSGSHPDRTHPAPMQIRDTGRNRYNQNSGADVEAYGSHCVSCHRSDMPLLTNRLGPDVVPGAFEDNPKAAAVYAQYGANNGESCARCHIGPKEYAIYKNAGASDFPHSGPGPKLLPKYLHIYNADYSVVETGTLTVDSEGQIENIDLFCLSCHASNRWVGAGM